jgi:hypothetical protein
VKIVRRREFERKVAVGAGGFLLHSELHAGHRRCREPARVPAVYPTHAFLAFLALAALREMNNLRVCSGLDGSIPTAPTNFVAASRLKGKSAPIRLLGSN